jgi:hypothetical protein
MTTLQQTVFLAQVQIGSTIIGYGNQEMKVTEVTNRGFKGLSVYCLEKFGKEQVIELSFATIQNSHYNTNLRIK